MKAKVASGSACVWGVVNLGWTPKLYVDYFFLIVQWVGYMPKILLALWA